MRTIRRPSSRLVLTIAGLFAILFPLRLQAQTETRWNGYLEHQYSVSFNEGRWTHLDYDRARVDLNAQAGRNTLLSVAVVGQLYRGNTETLLRDALPEALHALVDSAALPLEDRFYLNHAFITLHPGAIALTVGKQYLAWGAAYVFNPTELFRPKNVLEPGYEREGVGAITARLPLGVLSDIMIGLTPEGSFRTSGKLVRVRHHLAGFDLSALAAILYEPALPIRFNVTDRQHPERRRTLGGDATGELFGLGVWAEAAWSDHAGDRWVEATAGGNYTLRDGTLLLLEGHYNGRGAWSYPYAPALWFGRLAGGVRSLGKAILYGSVSRPMGSYQLWAVGLSALANVGDPSGVLVPYVSYAFAENVDLLFNGLVYLGSDGAEFGGQRFGGFLRGRVYF